MRFMLAALAALLTVGAAEAASLEAYGKLPIMDMVSISPDGTKIAFVQRADGKQAVVVAQLDPIVGLAGTPPSTQKIRGLAWAGSDHVLVTLSKEGKYFNVTQEWPFIFDLDLQKHTTVQLLKFLPFVIPALSGSPEVRIRNGHPTLFAPSWDLVPVKSKDPYKTEKDGFEALITYDFMTGDERVEEEAPSQSSREHWIIDEHGAVVASSVLDEKTGTWNVALRRNGAWATIYHRNAIDGSGVLGLSPDGGGLELELYTDRGYEVRPLSLAAGTIGAAQTALDRFSRLIEDPATGRVIAGRKPGLEPAYAFLNKKDQAIWDKVVSLFPDEYVDFIGWSADHNKVVARVTGLRHGVIYALVDAAAGQAKTLGAAYQGIGPNDLADVRIATYPAKDGRPIKALLTLPNGREPKNLPLIVLPHGGPADQDEAGFDWLAQGLASRGYAVLQPQFRGSTGFGWGLESAGFGEWGRKMQSDLSDGVRALTSQGFIDPKRVCIVGASYGGYAALAGVTLEQGVYRCAVSVAGPSDLRQQIGGPKVDAEHSSRVRYWDRFMGAKDPKDPILDQISPASHAAAAGAPILLIHGVEDTVVPIEQSRIMERALKRAGKPVDLVILKNEDHWLSREATRTQMLEATVAFLEKNNPPN